MVSSAGEPLVLISEHASTAGQKLQQSVAGFASRYPDWDPKESISAPYMFIYYSLPSLELTSRHCPAIETELLKQLVDSVLANYDEEFHEAKSCKARTVVSRKTMKYLIRPGGFLVQYSGTSTPGIWRHLGLPSRPPQHAIAANWRSIWTPTSQVRMMHNQVKMNPNKTSDPPKTIQLFSV